MDRTFVSIVLAVSSSAFTALSANAQTADAIGIRAQGMGGAFTAVADDATAAWWNPAGLATGPNLNAILEAGDDHHGGVSVAFPALALTYYRLRISQIQPSTSTDASSADRQDPGTGDVRLRSLDVSQFGATVGQSLGRYVVVASTLKVLRGGGSTKGSLDIGAMAALGSARLGLTVRDVTAPTLGDGAGALTLGRQVRAGVALTSGHPGALGGATLALDGDVTKVASATGDERRLAIGGEIWTRSRRFGGRAGLSWSTLGSARTAETVGASVAVRSGMYVDVQAGRSSSDDSRRRVGAALRVTF